MSGALKLPSITLCFAVGAGVERLPQSSLLFLSVYQISDICLSARLPPVNWGASSREQASAFVGREPDSPHPCHNRKPTSRGRGTIPRYNSPSPQVINKEREFAGLLQQAQALAGPITVIWRSPGGKTRACSATRPFNRKLWHVGKQPRSLQNPSRVTTLS